MFDETTIVEINKWAMVLQFWSILTAVVVRWRQRISKKCANKVRAIVFLIKSVFLLILSFRRRRQFMRRLCWKSGGDLMEARDQKMYP